MGILPEMIMTKRCFDILISFLALLIFSPLLVSVMVLVWRQDGHSPFYIAERVGLNGIPFKMVKLRSMVVNADKSGVDSTSSNDQRITPLGHFVRRYKLDELTQLWNVLIGEMSLVGPRPNVKRETDLYTDEERRLLEAKPGITDFASIVFSDEGEILKNYADPDIAYHQLIRPEKSRLGLFYLEKKNFFIDLQLLIQTAISIVSRRQALKNLVAILRKMEAPKNLIEITSRTNNLVPSPPPGAYKIVTSRESGMS